jgi:uncharacterized protein YfiM (DUF2279 family)
MKWIPSLLTVLFIGIHITTNAQFIQPSAHPNKKRIIATSAGIGIAGTGSLVGLYNIWYSKSGLNTFHTFDDCSNWMQMDKAGHVFTSYMIGQFAGDLFKWSGLPSKRSALFGASIGFAYQTTLEVFDGLSPDWGFSWCDVAANTAGSMIYLGQDLFLKEPLFRLKFSSHLTDYAQYRPEILGSSLPERLLKDYNGQTYWLSFSPSRFLNSSKFPEWLCLSIGYSIDQKLKADSDVFSINQNGSIYQFNAQRELLLSLDIDLSKLPVKSPWAKALLKQLNYLKIPFPTLIVRDNKITSSWLYF